MYVSAKEGDSGNPSVVAREKSDGRAFAFCGRREEEEESAFEA